MYLNVLYFVLMLVIHLTIKFKEEFYSLIKESKVILNDPNNVLLRNFLGNWTSLYLLYLISYNSSHILFVFNLPLNLPLLFIYLSSHNKIQGRSKGKWSNTVHCNIITAVFSILTYGGVKFINKLLEISKYVIMNNIVRRNSKIDWNAIFSYTAF